MVHCIDIGVENGEVLGVIMMSLCSIIMMLCLHVQNSA